MNAVVAFHDLQDLAADINEDSRITVTDVMAIVAIVVN